MTLSSAHVTLVNGKGTVTASVGNASAAPQRVVLGVFPSGGSGAGVPSATVEEPLRTIPTGVVEQYEVAFDTTGAAPGTYSFKLIPYSADDAPEDYAELGRSVEITVIETPVPPPKAKPWWILILIGALVVVGIVVAVVLATSQGSTPAPTPTLMVTAMTPSSGFFNTATTVTMTGRFDEPTTLVDKMHDSDIPLTRVSDTEYTFVMPATSHPQGIELGVTSAGHNLGSVTFEYTEPPLVVTPFFQGLTIDQAQALAAATGLVLDIQFIGGTNSTVFSQDPPAGQQVWLGSTIHVAVL
ncbi:hypothetical protein JF66_10590 [Cryobacterium sp. MLB-32]|uniref:PASTA domain-containing protein n=1 Tax=Cryobacterium sp. MLB-32 TaxID=1529318 RepID=UPI0004E6E742|nr:PASTA domain-containing protein [Cryobacterium sp. MLB-32]KFF59530.1 hypothetical protein JF66_10590 [Cryobacterium sp. MLB-32]